LQTNWGFWDGRRVMIYTKSFKGSLQNRVCEGCSVRPVAGKATLSSE
jgi:hypothetical protein